jgi:hypothetical protein
MTIARGCAARDPRRPARLLETNRQQFHPGSGRRAALARTGGPGPLSGGMAAPVDFGGIVHELAAAETIIYGAPSHGREEVRPPRRARPAVAEFATSGPPVPTGGRSTRWE